jgi:hypothetical protein
MNQWLIMIVCGVGVATASEYPKVDAALAECDARVADMRAQFARVPASPEDRAWIAAKLQHLADVDQYVRRFTGEGYTRGFPPREITVFGQKMADRMNAIDAVNTAELKLLVEKSGWFRISEFGAQADYNAWLLVQHADRDPEFQRDILKRLEPLAARDETRPSNFALLFDRVALSYSENSKRTLQRYGTQGQCTGPGTWAPHPVEDPDHLDQRRSDMGLGPIADYQKAFKDLCHESTEETLRKLVEASGQSATVP